MATPLIIFVVAPVADASIDARFDDSFEDLPTADNLSLTIAAKQKLYRMESSFGKSSDARLSQFISEKSMAFVSTNCLLKKLLGSGQRLHRLAETATVETRHS